MAANPSHNGHFGASRNLRNSKRRAAPDTIKSKNIKGVTEPPSPSLVTGVVGQSLTVAPAPSLGTVTSSALEAWPASPLGVPLSWSSAMRAHGVVTRVGGQQQQLEAFNVKITGNWMLSPKDSTLRSRLRK